MMKKYRKLLTLLLMAALLLTACNGGQSGVQLEDPIVLDMENGVLVWNSVAKAQSYKVTVNGEEVSVNTVEYDISDYLNTVGTYTITVAAVNGDKVSDPASITITSRKMPAPTLETDHGEFVWGEVAGAVGYLIQENGNPWHFSNDNSYTPKYGVSELTVKAVGLSKGNTYRIDSDASNKKTIIGTPKLELNNNTGIIFTDPLPLSGEYTYNLYVNGTLRQEGITNGYNLEGILSSGTYTIKLAVIKEGQIVAESGEVEYIQLGEDDYDTMLKANITGSNGNLCGLYTIECPADIGTIVYLSFKAWIEFDGDYTYTRIMVNDTIVSGYASSQSLPEGRWITYTLTAQVKGGDFTIYDLFSATGEKGVHIFFVDPANHTLYIKDVSLYYQEPEPGVVERFESGAAIINSNSGMAVSVTDTKAYGGDYSLKVDVTTADLANSLDLGVFTPLTGGDIITMWVYYEPIAGFDSNHKLWYLSLPSIKYGGNTAFAVNIQGGDTVPLGQWTQLMYCLPQGYQGGELKFYWGNTTDNWGTGEGTWDVPGLNYTFYIDEILFYTVEPPEDYDEAFGENIDGSHIYTIPTQAAAGTIVTVSIDVYMVFDGPMDYTRLMIDEQTIISGYASASNPTLPAYGQWVTYIFSAIVRDGGYQIYSNDGDDYIAGSERGVHLFLVEYAQHAVYLKNIRVLEPEPQGTVATFNAGLAVVNSNATAAVTDTKSYGGDYSLKVDVTTENLNVSLNIGSSTHLNAGDMITMWVYYQPITGFDSNHKLWYLSLPNITVGGNVAFPANVQQGGDMASASFVSFGQWTQLIYCLPTGYQGAELRFYWGNTADNWGKGDGSWTVPGYNYTMYIDEVMVYSVEAPDSYDEAFGENINASHTYTIPTQSAAGTIVTVSIDVYMVLGGPINYTRLITNDNAIIFGYAGASNPTLPAYGEWVTYTFNTIVREGGHQILGDANYTAGSERGVHLFLVEYAQHAVYIRNINIT